MSPLFGRLFICTFAVTLFAEDAAPKKSDDRYPAAVSRTDDAQAALKKFAVAPGLQVEVWASEPLLANPVALAFDDAGRAYVAETNRRRTSVPDIRKFDEWVIPNLALRSVEDRLAFFQRKFPESAKAKPTKDRPDHNGDGQFDWRDLGVESERIRVIEDTDGDGRADQSRVLAEGFNSPVTGTGAGVAVQGGEVFYTCVPDLWRIRADGTKEKLLTGFGVHVAYSGHDMHGAKIGPDGRLYFSIADCGAKIVGKEGEVIDVADTGAIFRCETDGSRLELVAKGLRNPQSLAWNELGDLFTGDNNADGGDKARWIHVVEGADYGWRIGWQFLPKLGAWNSEGMWHLDAGERHLATLPPVAHVGHGPAGIAYYPGTGLPEEYRDHFFMADFPGGVRAFKLTPKGASYTVENPGDILQDNKPQNLTGKMLWNLYPSDVAFAPGGGLFVLDWIEGWEKTGKGRIFRVFAPDSDKAAAETKRLLNEGFVKRSDDELAKLLGHADQRVRLGAQFALVRREKAGVLAQAASAGHERLARLHGTWGLAQLARTNPEAVRFLPSLAGDADAEVRAQWAKSVGEMRAVAEAASLVRLLEDPAARVQFFAAQTHARLGLKAPALDRLTAGHDAFVRFAARRALGRLGEGTHAIHDGSDRTGWAELASHAGRPGLAEPVWRRAVNANYLLGTAEAAQRLGEVALNADVPSGQRVLAVESLAIWNQPFGRDRITGLWRDLPPRSEAKGAAEVAAKILPMLLREQDEAVRLAAAELAGAQKVLSAEADLLAVASDAKAGGKVRAAALRALAAMDAPGLGKAVRAALVDKDKTLLDAARALAAKASSADAVRVNAAVLGTGSLREQQAALAVIAQQPGAEADRVLAEQLDLLAAGKLPKALWLDLLEAAAFRADAGVRSKLTAYEQARKADDALSRWRECLEGGDAKLGREIFYEKAEAGCLRCHKVKGEGGDVGPDLAGLAAKYDRENLLRAVVDPNASIAPGYDNVLLTMTDGSMAAGILAAEDAASVTLKSLVDGKTEQIAKAKIKERAAVPSAMPPGLGDVLGKRGLRDLVEYLATLK
jgi:quinoprotein glucose dehydrogenase